MNNIQIDIVAVDAIGYIAEENLQTISSQFYLDKSTGELYVQQVDSALRIRVNGK